MKIEEMTTWAKEFLLQDGTHAPTLFVETEVGQVIAELPDLPETTNQRLSYFLALGRHFAAAHPGENVRELAFIALSWASKQLPGEPAPKLRPSQDPNRVELLMISHLTVNPDHTVKLDGQMVEIIRDNDGKLRDLFHLPGSVEGGQSPVLVLFVLGARYPDLSEAEIKRLMLDALGPM